MSDFFGLQVGLSALYVARRAMEVTAQNITNANTAGYSRQRVAVSASGGTVVPSLHTKTLSQSGGVKVDGVERSRDAFLESRAVSEYATLSSMNRQQAVLNRVELIFNEPSETGLQSQLADLWAGFEDVANAPGSLAARSQLLERAKTIATNVNAGRNELEALWKTSTQQLATVVEGVNSLSSRLADLNGAIKRATASGLSPNELLDQRDTLALEVASLVGGVVRQRELGMIDIHVGGTALVQGEYHEKLRLDVPAGSNVLNADDGDATSVKLRWVKDGYAATIQGGEAGGLLDVANRMLPGYRSALDNVAQTLTTQVNAVHDDGVDLQGNPGGAFFGFTPATGLEVLITNASRIAAASAAPGTGLLDASNALALADLGNKGDGADNEYRTLIIQIGVDAQTTYRRFDIQTNITRQVDAARDATSGVSIDEELTGMVAYQHSFAAASRIITAIDEMLQRLIHGTGLVGR